MVNGSAVEWPADNKVLRMLHMIRKTVELIKPTFLSISWISSPSGPTYLFVLSLFILIL